MLAWLRERLSGRQIFVLSFAVIVLVFSTVARLNIEKWAEKHGLDQLLVEGPVIDVLGWVAKSLASDLAIGFALGAIIVAFWGPLLRPFEWIFNATSVGKRALTADQIQFRTGLKQFALTHPERIASHLGKVRSILIARIKESGDADYSFALHQAMHFARWRTENQYLTPIRELASADLNEIKADELQNAIKVFFADYLWGQRSLANLNVLAKIKDLRSLPETSNWLATDKECFGELQKLSVWQGATKAIKIKEDHSAAASPDNWTKPYRLDF